jgi:hypothetical protein
MDVWLSVSEYERHTHAQRKGNKVHKGLVSAFEYFAGPLS